MNYILLKKSTRHYFILAALIIIMTSNTVLCSQFAGQDYYALDRREIIKDDIYILSNDIEIMGIIEGDLSAACNDISCGGETFGNTNIVAFSTDLTGSIRKSARLFGNKIRLNCSVGGNLLAYGMDIRIGGKSVIEKDIHFGCESINIDGVCYGNVDGGANRVVISGEIEGNVDIKADRLFIISPAIIKGDLNYISPEDAIIDDDVVINGEVNWEREKTGGPDTGIPSWIRVPLFFMSLVTGLLFILVFKNHSKEAALQVTNRFWVNFAIGCLTLIILFGGAIIPAMFIIGIPISIIMFALGLILIYVGKIYVSIALGRFVVGFVKKEGKIAVGFEFILGLILLTALFCIPVAGWILYFAAFITGTGAAVSAYLSINRKIAAIEKSPS